MNIVKTMVVSMLASSVSLAAVVSLAEETERQDYRYEYMPMMQGQQGGMPMMQGQQGGMPMMQGQQGGMPMMQGQQGGMPMMQGQQGGMPMMQGQQGGMPMMQGQQGGMPMMQMIQQRHVIMDEHMRRMEAHLFNIEVLLKQLIELQKK